MMRASMPYQPLVRRPMLPTGSASLWIAASVIIGHGDLAELGLRPTPDGKAWQCQRDATPGQPPPLEEQPGEYPGQDDRGDERRDRVLRHFQDRIGLGVEHCRRQDFLAVIEHQAAADRGLAET